jgi:predicted small metal-binding protein
MHKHIRCTDVVPGCGFQAEAETEQELVDKVARHAAEVHGLEEVTPEVLAKVRAAIRDTAG